MISKFDDLFKKYAEDYKFNWKLIAALAFCESGFRADAVSPAGATGLMQIMPSTATWLTGRDVALMDPESNIEVGVRYMDYLYYLDYIHDAKEPLRTQLMLAAYNAGPGRLKKALELAEEKDYFMPIGKHLPDETVEFVKRVMNKYLEYSCHDGLVVTFDEGNSLKADEPHVCPPKGSDDVKITIYDSRQGYTPVKIAIRGFGEGCRHPVTVEIYKKLDEGDKLVDSWDFNVIGGDCMFLTLEEGSYNREEVESYLSRIGEYSDLLREILLGD